MKWFNSATTIPSKDTTSQQDKRLKGSVEAREERLKELKTQTIQAEERLKNLKNGIDEAIKSRFEEISVKEKELNDKRVLAEDKIFECSKQLEAVKANRDDLEQRIISANKTLDVKKTELAVFSEQLSKRDAELSKKESEVEVKFAQVEEELKDNIKVKSEYEKKELNLKNLISETSELKLNLSREIDIHKEKQLYCDKTFSDANSLKVKYDFETKKALELQNELTVAKKDVETLTSKLNVRKLEIENEARKNKIEKLDMEAKYRTLKELEQHLTTEKVQLDSSKNKFNHLLDKT